MAFVFDSVDKNKVDEGEWFSYEGSRFRIAATENIKFTKTWNRLTKQYKDLSKVSVERSLEITVESLVSGVLLDWEDVIDTNGNEVPFSKDNATLLLTNDSVFRKWVTDMSSDLDNFRKEISEQAVKK